VEPSQEEVKSGTFGRGLVHLLGGDLCQSLLQVSLKNRVWVNDQHDKGFKRTLIPGGGSKTKIFEMRKRLAGSWGWISLVRKSRKSGCGLSWWSLFSNWFNHWGAKWMFLRWTQPPDCVKLVMDFSARSKPSAEPMAIGLHKVRVNTSHWAYEASLTYVYTFGLRAAAKSSTLPLGSKPGAEQSKRGEPARLSDYKRLG